MIGKQGFFKKFECPLAAMGVGDSLTSYVANQQSDYLSMLVTKVSNPKLCDNDIQWTIKVRLGSARNT